MLARAWSASSPSPDLTSAGCPQPRGPAAAKGHTVCMAKDQIQISIPASDYLKLRAALCRVGCGNTPTPEEAALLHDLMKNLESSPGQLLSGSLMDGVNPGLG